MALFGFGREGHDSPGAFEPLVSAWLMRATFGYTRHLFFMRQMPPQHRCTAGSCRSITLWVNFPAGWRINCLRSKLRLSGAVLIVPSAEIIHAAQVFRQHRAVP